MCGLQEVEFNLQCLKNLAEDFDKADNFLMPDQFSFRKGYGTRDVIAALTVVCERNLKNNNNIYVCYVNFKNAFDRIN